MARRYTTQRLRLDRGGYHRGEYFGHDPKSGHVYRVYDEHTGEVETVRAHTASEAIKTALEKTAFSRKWFGKKFGSEVSS